MASDVDVSALTYEEALAELETLITRLERGDVDLEEAVACYQRGSALAQRCTALLDRTEAAVVQLVVGAAGVEEERPFAPGPPVADERAPASLAPSPLPSAERPRVPPPPGSPARARAVPAPAPPRASPAQPQRPPVPEPQATPARPVPAPELFPSLDRAPRTDPAEVDFDLDDIPF